MEKIAQRRKFFAYIRVLNWGLSWYVTKVGIDEKKYLCLRLVPKLDTNIELFRAMKLVLYKGFK